MIMRLFEAWRHHRCWHGPRVDTDRNERLAFQAGARHVLSQLINHLDGSSEANVIALHLNDEIRDFETVALR